ncbi:hypothetical protein PAPYR_7537 [Paratrimastix pyriformis]|uniref:Uncharacterized protein n=1 Tax=Paratrimastix pyriformis TaxID=342808 RepID=A0ABQ8UCL4_9EUKA|nr:hypothetical protein PAPYR_7537 [Paratrimastix pyriformis]
MLKKPAFKNLTQKELLQLIGETDKLKKKTVRRKIIEQINENIEDQKTKRKEERENKRQFEKAQTYIGSIDNIFDVDATTYDKLIYFAKMNPTGFNDYIKTEQGKILMKGLQQYVKEVQENDKEIQKNEAEIEKEVLAEVSKGPIKEPVSEYHEPPKDLIASLADRHIVNDSGLGKKRPTNAQYVIHNDEFRKKVTSGARALH